VGDTVSGGDGCDYSLSAAFRGWRSSPACHCACRKPSTDNGQPPPRPLSLSLNPHDVNSPQLATSTAPSGFITSTYYDWEKTPASYDNIYSSMASRFSRHQGRDGHSEG